MDTSNLILKVAKKGGLSLYGVGRFPVTLYKGQWKKVLAMKNEIEKFMEENDGELVDKGEKKEPESEEESPKEDGNIPDFDK